MTELAQWLRAQLDTDERIAQELVDHLMAGGSGPGLDGVHQTIRRHTYTWTPHRVFAEVGAKRLILDHVVESVRGWSNDWQDSPDLGHCAITDLNHVLKLLALPFAEREGYREEWRP